MHMDAAGSDGCSWKYIYIYLYVLIFIYAHEFNMERRCIEFDTVNVCVTINLYVKNPYDRIFALYLMSAEAFDLIRYTK